MSRHHGAFGLSAFGAVGKGRLTRAHGALGRALAAARQYHAVDPIASTTITAIASDPNYDWTLADAPDVIEYAQDSPLIKRPNGNYEVGPNVTLGHYTYQRSADYWGSLEGGNPQTEFVMDGDAFEFATQGGSQAENLAIMVDGKYTNLTGYPSPASNPNNFWYFRADFHESKQRTVRILGTRSMPLGKLRVRGSLLAPSPVGNTCYVLGDSILEGFDMRPDENAIQIIRDLTGIDEIINGSVGSTGYMYQNGGANFYNRRNSLLTSVDGGPPDACIIAGGINDNSYPDNDVGYWAGQLFSELRTAAPNMKIIVVGNFAPAVGWDSLAASRSAAIEAATQSVSDCHFVASEPIYDDPNWSDYFGEIDKTHPLPSGHKRMGEVLAAAIAPLIEQS